MNGSLQSYRTRLKSLLWLGLPLVLMLLTFVLLSPQQTTDKPANTFSQDEVAAQVVDALRLYTEANDGDFPNVTQFYGDSLMSQVQRELDLPVFTAASARWGFSHLTRLQRNDPTFGYQGAGRKPGQGDEVIVHWSISDSKHQAVFDNLEYRQVDTLELATLLSQWRTLAEQCVVAVEGGSGTLVSSDGIVLTASHLLNHQSHEATVVTANGTDYSATVLWQDQRLDAAFLRLNSPGPYPFVQIQFEPPRDSERLWVIGYQGGRDTPLIRSVELQRTVLHELVVSTENIEITGGDSGGPIINLHGQLVGIVIGPATADLKQVRATSTRTLNDAFSQLNKQVAEHPNH